MAIDLLDPTLQDPDGLSVTSFKPEEVISCATGESFEILISVLGVKGGHDGVCRLCPSTIIFEFEVGRRGIEVRGPIVGSKPKLEFVFTFNSMKSRAGLFRIRPKTED